MRIVRGRIGPFIALQLQDELSIIRAFTLVFEPYCETHQLRAMVLEVERKRPYAARPSYTILNNEARACSTLVIGSHI
jgi:hypothetical protein